MCKEKISGKEKKSNIYGITSKISKLHYILLLKMC